MVVFRACEETGRGLQVRQRESCGSRRAERGKERHGGRCGLLLCVCVWLVCGRLEDIQRGGRERGRLCGLCVIRGTRLYDYSVEDIALIMHCCSDAFNNGCQTFDNGRICDNISRCDRRRRGGKWTVVWRCSIIVVFMVVVLFIRHGDESGVEEG